MKNSVYTNSNPKSKQNTNFENEGERKKGFFKSQTFSPLPTEGEELLLVSSKLKPKPVEGGFDLITFSS